MEIIYAQTKDPRGESDGDLMGGFKKEKELDVRGWNKLLDGEHPDRPEGYSSAEEIANIKGLSVSHTNSKLRVLRAAGKIDAIQVRKKDGNIMWVYKD